MRDDQLKVFAFERDVRGSPRGRLGRRWVFILGICGPCVVSTSLFLRIHLGGERTPMCRITRWTACGARLRGEGVLARLRGVLGSRAGIK
ncbi:hypothetical protein FA13DRAFT_324058 [Coprinellus micaceus]|uniref:Uncharacterized protein n=1 Tax=Coprinellus micaceus TaxID=71717 RepID=A0A4Y7SFD8_COPMI|nr:hypothetical protein FA13DRAFT_324058 [Coprinellus micaceus]